jgi:cell shape-determining protein MreD
VFVQLGESSLVRAIGLFIIVLSIQTTVLSQNRPFSVVIDIAAVFAVAAGLIAGPRRGLRVAFLFGVVFDLLVGTSFGLKPLAYSIVAFCVSLLPYEHILSVRFLAPLTLGVAGGVAALLEILLAALSGRERIVSLRVFVVFAVVAVADFVIAPLAVRAVRWCLMVGDRPRL